MIYGTTSDTADLDQLATIWGNLMKACGGTDWRVEKDQERHTFTFYVTLDDKVWMVTKPDSVLLNGSNLHCVETLHEIAADVVYAARRSATNSDYAFNSCDVDYDE
jgi:hypothetical protein